MKEIRAVVSCLEWGQESGWEQGPATKILEATFSDVDDVLYFNRCIGYTSICIYQYSWNCIVKINTFPGV